MDVSKEKAYMCHSASLEYTMYKRWHCRFLLSVFCLILLQAAIGFGQTTRYVDYTASGANDGSTWANAYTSLFNALAASASTDSILVAQGTYILPDSSRDSSFVLKSWQKVLGGYPTAGAGARDWKAYPTVLCGDIGTPGDSSDNSYHVVKIYNQNNVLLDGFIIEGGYANGGGDNDYGGGVFMSTGWYKDTVQNCIVRTNFAKKRGGGIFSKNLKGLIRNCKIYSNASDSCGGGLFLENDSTHAINCVFVNNNALLGGAAYVLKMSMSADSIVNCTFVANRALYGGGFYNYGTGTWNPALLNTILWDNFADDSCDEICNISGSNPGIMNCDIKGCGGSSNWAGISFGQNNGGNLDTLPRFFDVDGADNIVGTPDDSLKLQSTSPCQMVGLSPGTYGIVPSADIEDSARSANTTLGAYEKLVYVSATTKKWENSMGDGLWSSGMNWFPDGPPLTTDTVILDGAISTAACTLNVDAEIKLINFMNSPGFFSFSNCTLAVKENADFSNAGGIVAGTGILAFFGTGNQIFIPRAGAFFPRIYFNSTFNCSLSTNSLNAEGLIYNSGTFNLGNYHGKDTLGFVKASGGTFDFGNTELYITDSANFRYCGTIYSDTGALFLNGSGDQYFTPSSSNFPDVIVNGTANVTVIDSNSFYLKSLTINSGGTLTAPTNNWMYIQEGFVNNGTFNHNNGTIEFDSTSGSYIIEPGGDAFNKIKFGTGGNMACYTFNSAVVADTLIVEYDTLDLGSATHMINVLSYGMSSELKCNDSHLMISGRADFSGFDTILVGTGMLELTATDTQTLCLPYLKPLPAILHSGAGKLKLDCYPLNAVSFSQTAGRLDFNYQNMNLIEDFIITNGTDSSFVNLADRKITVGGNAELGGQSSSLLNLKATARCTLSVTGNLTAEYATIGRCDAIGSPGIANASTCVDSMNNTGWTFLLDTLPPDNDMDLVATPIDTNRIVLTWNPSAIDSTDADSVGIWHKTGDYPDSAYDVTATMAGLFGLTDSVDTVTGLATNTLYYFGIMVRDDYGNWSDTSTSGNDMAQTAKPGVKIWDNGSGDYSWGTAANWYPDGTPAATDSVLFTSLSIDPCNFTGPDTVAHLTFMPVYSGTFTFTSDTLVVTGNADFTVGGAINHGAGCVEFTGVSSHMVIPNNNTDTLPNIVLNGAGGAVVSQNFKCMSLTATAGVFDISTNSVDMFVANNLTLNGGTLTATNGKIGLMGNLGMTSGTFNAPSDTMRCAGYWTQNGGTFNNNTGTVIFDNSAPVQVEAGASFYKLLIAGSNVTAVNHSLGVDSNIVISGGTLSASGVPLYFYNDVYIDGGSLILSSDTLDVTGGVFINSGTFQAPNSSGLFKLGREFQKNGGIFYHNYGTVEFVGTATGRDIAIGDTIFHKVAINSMGGAGQWFITGMFRADTLVMQSGGIRLDMGYAHYVQSLKATGGYIDFNSTTLQVSTGNADLSGLDSIPGYATGNLEFAGPGTQDFIPRASTVHPNVYHTASGTLRLSTNTLQAVSFSNTAGTFNFNGLDVTTTGDFSVTSGTSSTFAGLGGRKITTGGNASFSGQSGNLLNMNPGADWWLDVTGSLGATYATIGNSRADSGSTGFADETCVNSGANSNWNFWGDFPANLVGYYPFTGNAYDSSWYANNGTVNGPVLTTDRFGNTNNAYSFDGVDDYINAGDSPFPVSTESRTITAWFLTSVDYSTAMGTIVNWGTGTADFQEIYLCIQRSGTDNVVQVGTGGANSHTYGTTVVNDGRWHFAAATYSGGVWKLYVDGVDETNYESGSSPTTNTVPNGLTTIGCAVSYDQRFNGAIDEVRIYNNILSVTQIDSLYRLSGWPYDEVPPSVVALSPADNAADVGLTANLVMTFNEKVYAGSGNIVLAKSADLSVFETIAVGSANVTGSGTTMITINPSLTFASRTGYYVVMDATCFRDSSNNYFLGYTSDTQWNFTTVDNVTEVPSISLPASGSTIGDTFSVAYMLPERAANGSVTMTFSRTGGSADVNAPHVVTFIPGYELTGSHTTILSGNDLSNNANVASVNTDPDDMLVYNAVYTVAIQYQDSIGNPAAGAQNTTVVYQGGSLANNVTGTLTSQGDSAITVALTLSNTQTSGVQGIYFNLTDPQDTGTIDTLTAFRLAYKDTTFTVYNTTDPGIWYGHWALYDNTGKYGTIRYDSVVIQNTAPVVVLPSRDTTYEDSVWTMQVGASDLNGDTLTLTAPNAPTGLTVSQSPFSLTWTPTNADVGTHTIPVVVTDSRGGQGNASLILTVMNTNDAPTLDTSLIPTTVYEDSVYSGSIIVSDPDAGDSISITLTPALPWMQTQITSNSAASKWTIALSGVPANKDVGTSTVNFRIADRSGSPITFSQSFTVINTNDYPIVDSVSLPDSVYEDSLVFGRVVVHDPDLGDSVSLSLGSDLAWLTVQKLTVNTGDTVSTFTISGRPGNADTGMVQILMRAVDRDGLSAVTTQNLYVVNTNDPPQTVLRRRDAAYGAVNYVIEAVDDFDSVFTFATRFVSPEVPYDTSLTNTNGIFSFYPLPDGQYYLSCTAIDQDGVEDPTPFIDTLTIARTSTHTWSDSGVWNMLSVPSASYNAELLKSAGTISHWDESQEPNGIYKYYTRADAINDIAGGNAYWVRVDTSVTVSLARNELGARDSFVVQLNKAEYGWNQIASPYPYPVRWNSTHTLWEWDASRRDFVESDGVLYPWEGYWVLADSPQAVTVRSQPLYTGKALTRRAKTLFVDKTEWTFRISLASNINRDADNLFGISRHARNGYDALDRPEPPRMGNEPFIFFAHPEWKMPVDRFASDIRRTWDEKTNIFQVGIAPCAPEVTDLRLTITGYSDDLSLYLFVNTPSGVKQYTSGTSLAIPPLPEEQYRTIFASTDKDFLKNFPFTFVLNHPYPNPCRPATTIHYTLPYRWDRKGWLNTEPYAVRLIIYDARGRAVRELVNRKQEPGKYRVAWRGKSDTGRMVASGFYFCRLVAGKYSSVERIIVLR